MTSSGDTWNESFEGNKSLHMSLQKYSKKTVEGHDTCSLLKSVSFIWISEDFGSSIGDKGPFSVGQNNIVCGKGKV